jgi:peptidoglycan-N-acetylglucosamine deacetylase
MSPFAIITWAAVVLATIETFTLPFPARLWGLLVIWLIYLPICAAGVVFIRMNFFTRAVCRGSPGRKRIALTFDDGPDPQSTPAVLDLLRQEKIEAAFFCIGKNVAAHPELAARIVGEGHLVGNHTYGHPWLIPAYWGRRLENELRRGQEAIEKATGVISRFFRPPSGLTGAHFPKVLKRLDLTLIGWDVRSLDTVLTSEGVMGRIRRLTKDGSIIVLHDGGRPMDKVLEIVRFTIVETRARGFEFERLDRLIGVSGERILDDAGGSIGEDREQRVSK